MKLTIMFASRAGEKLNFALEHFGISVTDKLCADLGASTGGFSDCLLQRGAKHVWAVETGYGLLDWKLRNDQRVTVLERTNALHVALPELMDFISIDVSWTKQRLIVPHALTLLKKGGDIISLLKPHYEAPPSLLRKGRLNPEQAQEILERVLEELTALNITVAGYVISPITGSKGGNIEYLLWIKPS